MPCRPDKKPSGRRRFVLQGPNPGLKKDGNIDLYARPLVPNHGAFSTVDSVSFGSALGEILVPTVVGHSVVTPQAAIRHYERTKEQLGIFDSIKHANWYAERLHEQQARIYCLQ